MTTTRRGFLGTCGAAAALTLLPGGKVVAAQPPPTPPNPHGEFWWEWGFLNEPYADAAAVATRSVLVIRDEGTGPFEQPTEAVTPGSLLLSSPNGKYVFRVVRDLPIEVIPYYISSHDAVVQRTSLQREHQYGGVVVEVEAIAPGIEYYTCPIRAWVGDRAFEYVFELPTALLSDRVCAHAPFYMKEYMGDTI